MIYSAPLEDARHLVNHYDRLRQEVEAQVKSWLTFFWVCFEAISDFLRHEQFVEKKRFFEQATDVLRRRSKLKESDVSEETYMKLKNSESRLAELKSSMKTLGKEATKAMLEVDEKQQNVTYQRLCALVNSALIISRLIIIYGSLD